MGCGVGGGTFKGCEFEYFKALRPETKVELPEKKKTIVLHSMKMKKSCPIDNDNLHFINVKLLTLLYFRRHSKKILPPNPLCTYIMNPPKLGKHKKRPLQRLKHQI